MKAAVLSRIGQPLHIEEVPRPEVAAGEVLVETRTCGICRTDIHLQDGLAYTAQLPHILGHEPAGVVVAMGAGVTGLKEGDRVVPHLFFTCGQCRYCRSGRDAQCSALAGILGVSCAGGFAEYFKAPANNMLVLPDSVPWATGGLVSCAGVTAVHAYRRGALSAGETAVVIGAGGIGLILIQLLAAAGVHTIAVSRSTTSLELARDHGAEDAFSVDQPRVVQRIADLFGGEGARTTFDCVGTSRTMRLAAGWAVRGGRIVVIGEEPDFAEISTTEIAQKELEIVGSRNGSRQDAADAIGMLASGMIDPPIAGTYRLEEINEALERLRHGQADGRLVVEIRS